MCLHKTKNILHISGFIWYFLMSVLVCKLCQGVCLWSCGLHSCPNQHKQSSKQSTWLEICHVNLAYQPLALHAREHPAVMFLSGTWTVADESLQASPLSGPSGCTVSGCRPAAGSAAGSLQPAAAQKTLTSSGKWAGVSDISGASSEVSGCEVQLTRGLCLLKLPVTGCCIRD